MFTDPTATIANALQTLEQSGITKLTIEDAQKIVNAKDPLAKAEEVVAKSGEVVVIGKNTKEDYWGECLQLGALWVLALIGRTIAMLFSAIILPTSIRILYEAQKKGGCEKCSASKDGCGWHNYCAFLCVTSSLSLLLFLIVGLRYAYGEGYGIWPWMENLVNSSGGKPTLQLVIFLISAANIFSGLIEIGHHLKKRNTEASAQKTPTPASHS